MNLLESLPDVLLTKINEYANYTPKTYQELKIAVNEWCENKDYIYESVLNKYGHISLWNTENITDMSYLFSNFRFNDDISKWNVSNVTNMNRMFRSTKSFNQPLNDWDVSNVTNMNGMFYMTFGKYKAHSIFNQPLDKWNVSNVINMNDMFCGAKKFNQSLNNWDVSNVRNMDRMFGLSMQQLPKWYKKKNSNNLNIYL